MSNITKDLGGITAYADAVAGGYTGTKAQWETLMASYASVAQAAAASASAAATSATAASQSANSATTSAAAAASHTARAFNTTVTYEAGDYVVYNSQLYIFTADKGMGDWDSTKVETVYMGDELTALKEDIKDNYAKNDGYYDGMTVGNAEQIVGTVFEEDDTAYNYRTTGGSAEVGDRAYVDAIVGGSLPWNQLTKDTYDSGSGNGVTWVNNGDGSWTINGECTGVTYIWMNNEYGVPDYIKPNHKYILIVGKNKDAILGGQCHLYGEPAKSYYITYPQDAIIISMPDSVEAYTSFSWVIAFVKNQTYTDVVVRPQMFDLTAMFGSTIADYIYSLETAHAGDGVAWFKRYFPKPYYAYHAVGMEHVNAVSAKTVGFNQFDKSTIVEGYIDNEDGELKGASPYYASDYIPVIPSAAYYIKTGQTQGLWGAWYDADKNFIQGITNYANSTITAPSNAHFVRLTIKVGTNGDENAFCVSIRWDNSRDGDYEPYNLHTYPLADITLRGIPKKDESGNLYFDGDRYLADGTVERRYGIVDLGTLTWNRTTSGSIDYFYNQSSTPIPFKQQTYPTDTTLMCEKFVAKSNNNYIGIALSEDNTICYGAAVVCIRCDSYTDTASFKAAMSGVYLVYELATPTTEEADPYQYPMVVDNWGTEEFVDGLVESGDRDVAIPVGHETKYPPNLKDKLESAANNPDADGVYVLTHDGGSNTYTPLASNATIQNIIARLEALEGGGE